jgi:hypothetical protein
MRNWVHGLVAGLLLALVPVGEAQAQRAEATESSVKAAFLYKFAGYIEWPPGLFAAPDGPFVIAVTGSDEVAAEMARIATGRSIGGHPVVVKRLREGEPLKGIHLLFLGRDAPRQPALLKLAQQQSVFTVTEAERGLEQGSAINFVVAEDRVGFEVSLEAAEKTGHHISARMLAVARRVLPRT